MATDWVLKVVGSNEAEAGAGIFVDMLAHDLRSPLGTIMLAAGHLLGSNDAGTARSAARIAASAGRMRRMIDDLLELARTSHNHMRLQRSRFDLGQLCDDVLGELRAARPDRALRLESAGDLAGEWDRDRLAQVIENLVGNALDHGSFATPVVVTVRGQPAAVIVEVANQGPEIPAEAAAHIFEPFHRASLQGEGVGLGLYIVRRIVMAHGGSVGVDSDARETRFRMRLPRWAPAGRRLHASDRGSCRETIQPAQEVPGQESEQEAGQEPDQASK